jgi:hypothetical protein
MALKTESRIMSRLLALVEASRSSSWVTHRVNSALQYEKPVLRIRIHMFLGLLDPDPDTSVRGMDPDPDPDPYPDLDPSITKQKN